MHIFLSILCELQLENLKTFGGRFQATQVIIGQMVRLSRLLR